MTGDAIGDREGKLEFVVTGYVLLRRTPLSFLTSFQLDGRKRDALTCWLSSRLIAVTEIGLTISIISGAS